MFWGCTIKKGNDHKFEADDQAILHVSNAALGLNNKAGSTSAVFAKVDGKEFVITHLTQGKNEHTSLDLYFRNDQEVTFGVKGEAEVHLSGYFEPDHGDDEDMYEDFPYGEEDDEEEDDEEIEEEDDESEEEKPAPKKPITAEAKKAPAAPAKKIPEVPAKKTEAAAPKPAEVKKQPSLQETLALKKAAEKVAAAAFEGDEDEDDEDDLDMDDEDLEDDDDEDLEDDDDEEIEDEDEDDIDDDVSDSEGEALNQLLKKSKGNNGQATAKPQAQAQKPQQ